MVGPTYHIYYLSLLFPSLSPSLGEHGTTRGGYCVVVVMGHRAGGAHDLECEGGGGVGCKAGGGTGYEAGSGSGAGCGGRGGVGCGG